MRISAMGYLQGMQKAKKKLFASFKKTGL